MIETVLKCSVLVALLMLPSGVSAQSLVVQAGAGPDIKRFSDEAGQSAYDGTALAVVFGIGQEIASHWVISAEVDLGGRSTRRTTTDGVIISGQSRVIHNSYTSQRRSVAVFAGYRTAAHRRVRLG